METLTFAELLFKDVTMRFAAQFHFPKTSHFSYFLRYTFSGKFFKSRENEKAFYGFHQAERYIEKIYQFKNVY